MMNNSKRRMLSAATLAAIAFTSVSLPHASAQDAAEPNTAVTSEGDTSVSSPELANAGAVEGDENAVATPPEGESVESAENGSQGTESEAENVVGSIVYDEYTAINKDNSPLTLSPLNKKALQGVKDYSLDTVSMLDGWDATIDPATGVISVSAPQNAKPGDYATLTVSAKDRDGNKIAGITVVSVEGLKDTVDPAYGSLEVKPGETLTGDQFTAEMPQGTTFALAADFPEEFYAGWVVEVNPETGAVTATAPKDAKAGSTLDVPVAVTYTDGTFEVVKVKVSVSSENGEADGNNTNENNNESREVAYVFTEVVPGEQSVIKQAGENIPEGTTFTIPSNFTAPEGWQVAIDAATGDITVVAAENTPLGTSVEIPVIATFADGSTASVSAKINVIASTQAETGVAANHAPGYAITQLAPGESKTIKQSADKAIPEGTVFSVSPDFTPPTDWMIDVDPVTGAVTISAPATAQAGKSVTVPIVATYPDGTVDTAKVNATVIGDVQGANNAPKKEDKKVNEKEGGNIKPGEKPSGTTEVDVEITDGDKKKADDASPQAVGTAPDESQSRVGRFFSNLFTSPNVGKAIDGVADYAVADRLAQASAQQATPKTVKSGPAVHTGGHVKK